MSTTNFSPNSSRLLSEAKRLASSFGHDIIGTEHFVYALCNDIADGKGCSRALAWIASVTYPGKHQPMDLLANDITTWITCRPHFKESVVKMELPEPVYSESMEAVLEIAKKIGFGPVRDGDIEYKEGLVASEFILAAMLVEGTGLGVEALTRYSKGKVNAFTLLKAINVDSRRLNHLQNPEETWKEFSVEKEVKGSVGEKNAWFPDFDLSDITELPTSPTPGSNWLVPNRLLIGERPNKENSKLLVSKGKVNVFVSLIGEYSTKNYKNHQYPSTCTKNAKETLHFIHCPIKDFSVVEEKVLMNLVKLLHKKLLQGNTLYIHCRGGHGRTGIVVIPLISVLFGISVEEAQTFVVWATRNFRKNDIPFANYIHMPETSEQIQLINIVSPLLREWRH